MKSPGYRRLQALSFVYRILMICLFALGLIIIGGTIYGVFFHTGTPDHKPNKQIDVLRKNGEGQTFTGIGRLRVSTADPQPGMVIIFVSFVYNPDDKAFSEELVLRIGDFRHIIEAYFSSLTTSELQKQGEERIKSELLRRFNTVLKLGQIETIYFSDFMIIG